MKIRAKTLVCTALFLLTANAAWCAELPPDSIYQLHITLTNQDGKSIPLDEHRGKPQLVSMFYTSCTMVCPMITDTLKATRGAIGNPASDRVNVLVVSFDPDRDDASSLHRYAETHKLDLSHWTLARAEPGDVRRLAALLGLQYRKLPDGDFNHSSELVLLDTEGRIVARSTTIGRTDPAFLAAVRKAAGAP